MSSQAYLFAHRALPQQLFADPGRFLAIVNGPDAGRYLADLWRHCGKFIAPGTATEPPPLSAEAFRVDDRIVAVIAPPTPTAPTEAHRIVVVAGLAPGAADLSGLTDVRYFTLEYAIDITTEAPMTMLCEWTAKGVHRNHGGGPTADAPARALLDRAIELFDRGG